MTDRRPARDPGTEDAQAARKVMNRAIRRLNVLEWLLLGAAAIASLVGGWLAALLGRSALGLPFRGTWITASLLLFLIPGAIAWIAERRSRATPGANGGANDNEDKPE